MNLIYFRENHKQNLSITDEEIKITNCVLKKELLELLSKKFNLLIVDHEKPAGKIVKLCKLIRKSGFSIPILIISSEKSINTKVLLLNAGADDYLEKPFDPEELRARIKALSRRPFYFYKAKLTEGDLFLDKDRQAIILKEKLTPLTKKEFLILEYLMSRPNELISRADLLEHAWGLKANFFSKSIEMHILKLRKKTDPNKTNSFIQTVSGRGYIFNQRSK